MWFCHVHQAPQKVVLVSSYSRDCTLAAPKVQVCVCVCVCEGQCGVAPLTVVTRQHNASTQTFCSSTSVLSFPELFNPLLSPSTLNQMYLYSPFYKQCHRGLHTHPLNCPSTSLNRQRRQGQTNLSKDFMNLWRSNSVRDPLLRRLVKELQNIVSHQGKWQWVFKHRNSKLNSGRGVECHFKQWSLAVVFKQR